MSVRDRQVALLQKHIVGQLRESSTRLTLGGPTQGRDKPKETYSAAGTFKCRSYDTGRQDIPVIEAHQLVGKVTKWLLYELDQELNVDDRVVLDGLEYRIKELRDPSTDAPVRKALIWRNVTGSSEG